MKPVPTIRLLLACGALLSVAACDRSPRSATPAPGQPAIESGAMTTPVPAGTVALSGAIRDLPPTTTPDALAPPSRGGAVTAPRQASGSASTSTRPPIAAAPAARPPAGETAAMREFREAQERRDRELLDRDMNAARDGRSAGTAAPPDPVEPRDDPAGLGDDGADELPPDDADQALPPDDASADELPPEDLPPDEDELPPADEDLRWDPATGTWR